MRVICYAINGSGIGHLKRLTAIARHLPRYAEQYSIPLEIYFLTSSEASHILFSENFPSFKFPSREVLTKAGTKTESFIELIKCWTAETLKLLKPDLLIVDTFPAGYYDELIENLHLCRQTAVIHRPLKFDNLDKNAFYKSLGQYDSIIVPENEILAEIELPVEIKDKIKCFGPVMCREKGELLDRKMVRRMLNLDDEDFVIYLSAGGGGDDEAERYIHHLYNSLCSIPNAIFVVGAGALYRGQRIYAPNVIWLTNENAFEMMPGFDAAISAAGYNSFHELLYAGVPTLFIPQSKWADDQFQRANKAKETVAAAAFEKLPEAAELQNFIEKWRKGETSRFLSQNAQKLVPKNYASNIAGFLFDKLFSA